MTDTLNVGGLIVGPCMVRGYIERIKELQQELAIGVNVIRDYEERIEELEIDAKVREETNRLLLEMLEDKGPGPLPRRAQPLCRNRGK